MGQRLEALLIPAHADHGIPVHADHAGVSE